MYDFVIQNGFIFTVLTLITCILLYRSLTKSQHLPPGPPALVPILGNLYNITPSNILQKLRDYRKKYGDIYSLKLGSKTVVVVSGYDMLKDVFVKNADVFSHRPNIFAFNILEGYGIITSSGDSWKKLRSFALGALRRFGFGKESFESNIMKEVNELITIMEETKGCSFDISYPINAFAANVVWSIVFGRRFEHTDAAFIKLLDLLDEGVKLAGVAAPLNFIPLVKYIPGDPFKYHVLLDQRQEFDSFVSKIIEEHTTTYDPENQRDFIDMFLDERARRQQDLNNTFNDKQLLRVVQDFFIAGTETISTSLKWTLLYLLNYPEIQIKMRKEIESIVGSSRYPSYKDRSSLPFCEAVITEVLRCSNIFPLSVFHAASRDVVYNGYSILEGTIIIPNLESVMMDDTLFPEPTKFNPYRFLDKDGKFGGHEKVIAFSFGRRMCLGESIARMELFLFLTTVIQRFIIKPEVPKQPPSLEGILGATYSPKPFLIRVEKIF